MRFFYPQLAEHIDWSKGYTFMDKELQALTNDSMVGKKFVDKLVKVHSKTGQEGFVLLHSEIQDAKEEDFPARLYNLLLPVVGSLPITHSDACDIGRRYKKLAARALRECCVGDPIVTFRFFVSKLLDYVGYGHPHSVRIFQITRERVNISYRLIKQQRLYLLTAVALVPCFGPTSS